MLKFPGAQVAVAMVACELAENATKVVFLLDGSSQKTLSGNAAVKGTVPLPFPCNEKKHEYTLVASGAGGKPDRASVTVYRS